MWCVNPLLCIDPSVINSIISIISIMRRIVVGGHQQANGSLALLRGMLPVGGRGGGTGTLKHRLHKCACTVQAKTGTLTGVSSLSGYISLSEVRRRPRPFTRTYFNESHVSVSIVSV